MRKGRAVVDGRRLNKDSYPLPRQEDIITALRGSAAISIIDAVPFFHQWGVAEKDRPKLAVNTHLGQEHFNVWPLWATHYVQRRLDIILHSCRAFAKAFIDDMAASAITTSLGQWQLDESSS